MDFSENGKCFLPHRYIIFQVFGNDKPLMYITMYISFLGQHKNIYIDEFNPLVPNIYAVFYLL